MRPFTGPSTKMASSLAVDSSGNSSTSNPSRGAYGLLPSCKIKFPLNLNPVNLGQLLVGLTFCLWTGEVTPPIARQRTAALEGSLNTNNGWQRMIKRGVHTLKKSQYQLCYVDSGMAAVGEEMEQLKYIDSILVEL